jgi:hypothetical protein
MEKVSTVLQGLPQQIHGSLPEPEEALSAARSWKAAFTDEVFRGLENPRTPHDQSMTCGHHAKVFESFYFASCDCDHAIRLRT